MPSKDVFIPKKTAKKRTPDMVTLMGNKPANGEVGLEIEMEGKKLPTGSIVPPEWRYVEDHSLRAPKGGMTAEYVLARPIMFKEVPKALDNLWAAIKKNGGVIVDSNRTSAHVHVNCQKWYLNRVTAFAALYFIVEEVLTEWCGEHRVGNLFCLRAKDAEAIVSYLRAFIEADGQAGIQEFLHYSAFNANALKKFGSLELRTLRGTSEPETIVDWVETIERLYTLSEEFPDPREICTSLSSIGPLTFFNNILGPRADAIRKGVDMTDQQISTSVYEGVRFAQDLAYCKDWDTYAPMKLKPDIFGRSMKTIAQKLMNADYNETMTPSPWPQMPQELTAIEEMQEEYPPEYDEDF